MANKKEEPKRRSLNAAIDAAISNGDEINVAGISSPQQPAQGGGEPSPLPPAEPAGVAAEKPCFVTLALPESIKRIIDIKVKYDSKDVPPYNQTLKHIGRRWLLRGLLTEGLITQEQFDEAAALHSEYGWEREKVAAKRRR